jgi:8-oxo-dGTP pyrophosphatase MutT (NUDIX family)
MSQRPGPWTAVAAEPLQDCVVFRVSRTLARSPHTGSVHPFFRIDADAWVNVVALTDDDRVVLVRQWRHGAGEVTLEIPGGAVDPGESPQAAAERELLEETGFRARALESLGVLNPNPALFGNRVHTFVARGCERVSEVRNHGLEETAVELVPRGELRERVRAGQIDHALVVAALHLFELAGAGDVAA